ncbi:M20 metallopeptidase family protein [Halarsenatibacter silvermanii]|uniref:Amidohydrolase n=1 Tax=Halarsenatibacter silvermanii TaxID=321763 RepID=A0A1G9GYR0_9FIRM|nr:amidohydrolase [Halarsenatibacter silvermanii]SDL05423.1 amidohydrolase [Halarsenatibacter silvermanii]
MKPGRKAAELEEEIISLRRDFHRHPELGREEHRTSGIVCDYLEKAGLEVRRAAETGVIGLLEGEGEGGTVMLRADMDAVPVQEENDFPYSSTVEGVAHCCGHDGHTSMLLGAAKILSEMRSEIEGNIKFVFQPNEEEAGAHLMIDEGVMENPSVDAVFGIHLWSLLKSGTVGICAGPMMASSHYFELEIQGTGGHAGAPHNAVDPVACAGSIMDTVYTMQSRELDALEPTVISFCSLDAPSSPTIIPEKASLSGSIRCLHEEFSSVRERFERTVAGVCTAHDVDYELEISRGNSLLKNDEELTELVRGRAADLLGGENLESEVEVMLGEDFAEYGYHAPLAFCFLGIADEDKGTHYPHHHPRFDIDENMLTVGTELHVRNALAFLECENYR